MKELKDFPGYFITEDGKVYSTKYNKLKELKLFKNTKGYYMISLFNNGKKIHKLVHRLVAETYIPNPDNLPEVNHKDENKTNNHASNLEWITHHKNIIHSNCRWIWEIENIVTGEIKETINIKEFSRDNNLDQSHLIKTFSGKQKQHKNFKIISKTQFK